MLDLSSKIVYMKFLTKNSENHKVKYYKNLFSYKFCRNTSFLFFFKNTKFCCIEKIVNYNHKHFKNFGRYSDFTQAF